MTPKQRSVAIRWAATTTGVAALINALPLMQLALGASYADVSAGRGLEVLVGLALLILCSLGVAWVTGMFVLSLGVGTLTTFIWVVAQLVFGLALLYAYPLGAPYFNLYIGLRAGEGAGYAVIVISLYFVPALILGAVIGAVGAGIGWLGRPVSR